MFARGGLRCQIGHWGRIFLRGESYGVDRVVVLSGTILDQTFFIRSAMEIYEKNRVDKDGAVIY